MPLFAQVLNVTGDERYVMGNNFLQLAIMPMAFTIGGYLWGVSGIAIAWVVGHPPLAFRLARHTLKRIDLTVAEYFKSALAPALTGCAVMLVTVVAVRTLAYSHLPMGVLFGSEIVFGAIAYCGTIVVLYRGRLRGIRSFIMSMVRGRGVASGAAH